MHSPQAPQTRGRAAQVVPDRAGVGFKTQHAETILETRANIGWLEVHPENYMVAGGPRQTCRLSSHIVTAAKAMLGAIAASAG